MPKPKKQTIRGVISLAIPFEIEVTAGEKKRAEMSLEVIKELTRRAYRSVIEKGDEILDCVCDEQLSVHDCEMTVLIEWHKIRRTLDNCRRPRLK